MNDNICGSNLTSKMPSLLSSQNGSPSTPSSSSQPKNAIHNNKQAKREFEDPSVTLAETLQQLSRPHQYYISPRTVATLGEEAELLNDYKHRESQPNTNDDTDFYDEPNQDPEEKEKGYEEDEEDDDEEDDERDSDGLGNESGYADNQDIDERTETLLEPFYSKLSTQFKNPPTIALSSNYSRPYPNNSLSHIHNFRRNSNSQSNESEAFRINNVNSINVLTNIKHDNEFTDTESEDVEYVDYKKFQEARLQKLKNLSNSGHFSASDRSNSDRQSDNAAAKSNNKDVPDSVLQPLTKIQNAQNFSQQETNNNSINNNYVMDKNTNSNNLQSISQQMSDGNKILENELSRKENESEINKKIIKNNIIHIRISHEKMQVAPENFSMVVNGIYRSSFPRPDCFEFLRKLGIKSILVLIPEKYPEENLELLKARKPNENDENNNPNTNHEIKVFQVGMPGNKEPFVHVPHKTITKALEVALNPENHPILIHCNRGKHRTGCVVGCIRRLQNWSMTMIFDEYRRFAFPKARPLDQQLIELYDDSEIYELALRKGWLPLKW